MRKKLTIKEMQGIAKKRGGKCLSKNYVNNYTKLKWECKKGHRWEAIPYNIKIMGTWCPKCSRKKTLTIEKIQAEAKKRGGNCLSKRYVNNQVKLKWECSEGHQWKSRLCDVRNGGHWCPVCAGNKPLTFKDMRAIAKEHGGKCLSKHYVNSQTKLKWECAKEHQWWATPNNVKNLGQWCPVCAGNKTLTIKDMKVVAKKYYGKCLSRKYVNNQTKLKWECAEGHHWDARPTNVKNLGQWCPTCTHIKKIKRKAKIKLTPHQ